MSFNQSNKAQFTTRMRKRPGLKTNMDLTNRSENGNIENDVFWYILGPGLLVNRVTHSHQNSQGVSRPKG